RPGSASVRSELGRPAGSPTFGPSATPTPSPPLVVGAWVNRLTIKIVNRARVGQKTQENRWFARRTAGRARQAQPGALSSRRTQPAPRLRAATAVAGPSCTYRGRQPPRIPTATFVCADRRPLPAKSGALAP